jgi:hypothetical protein
MHLSGRVLLSGAAAVLLLSLPAVGLANGHRDPLREPGVGPRIALSGGPSVAAPALVPGAMVGSVGTTDGVVYSDSAGGTVVTAYAAPVYWLYSSVDLWPILASLGLPAGATLWQVDVYGYTSGATSQSWALIDENIAAGDATTIAGSATTSTGPGLVQGTISYASGLTLAPGHMWKVDLYGSTLASGYVGAVFQYTLPTVSLVPITPVRVFDSRFSSKIVQGTPRTINVKDAINITTGAVTTPNAIPLGARAVSFTVTVTGTANAGYVAVLPGTTTAVTASAINWTDSGATLASGGMVSLGTGTAERQVTLVVGGSGAASTNVILDITGYYR